MLPVFHWLRCSHAAAPLRSWQCHAFACLILSLVMFLPRVAHAPPIVPYADSVAYLSVAADLHDTGIYADGNFRHLSAVTGKQGQGMFFGPLYPSFLAILMHFDPGLRDMGACVEHGTMQTDVNCPIDYSLVLPVQGVIVCVTYWLLWLAGFALTRRKLVGWMTFALGVPIVAYIYFGTIIMTEVLTFPLFTASVICAALAWRRQSWKPMAAAGVCWGLLSLNRPSYPYGLYVTVLIALPVVLYRWRRGNRAAASMVLALVCGYLLTAGPWMARNAVTFGAVGLSRGYDGYILAQRLAYNDMTAKEWGASFVYVIPHLGRLDWVQNLVDPIHAVRFDYDNPDGFYYKGNHVIEPESLKAAGSHAAQTSYLIHHYLLARPVKHVLVTFAMAWGGMWFAQNWMLFMLPLYVAAMVRAARRRDWTLFVFSWPGWIMLGFNAFTSVNITRYNFVLLPCIAVGAAMTIAAMLDWAWARRKGAVAV